MFGLMLCYHCLEILNKFCTRSPTFLFCTELHKLCTQSCPSYFLFAKNCMDDVNSLFGGVVQRADGKRRLKLWFRCNYFICFRNLPQPCPHTLTPHQGQCLSCMHPPCIHHSVCITVYACLRLYIVSASDGVSQRVVITIRVTGRCAYRILGKHLFRIQVYGLLRNCSCVPDIKVVILKSK